MQEWLVILAVVAIISIYIFGPRVPTTEPRMKNAEHFLANMDGHQSFPNLDNVYTDINNPTDHLNNPFDKYDNTHRFLYRDLIPGNEHINRTTGYIPKSANPSATLQYYISEKQGCLPDSSSSPGNPDQWELLPDILDQPSNPNRLVSLKTTKQRGGEPAPYINTEHPVKGLGPKLDAKLDQVQPHFFDQIHLSQKNGLRYHDKRYPEEMVSVDFLKNPDQFCQNNWFSYPCYRRLSKWNDKC